MKIYIIGAGGVGGFLGIKLAKAGSDVTFLVREKSAKIIRQKGLILKTPEEEITIKPAKVISRVDEIKDPDLIIFTVKTYDTEQVASELKKVISDRTVIISFQNGINNDLEIQKFTDSKNAFQGIAYIVSHKIAPNTIEQMPSPCKFIIGDRNAEENSTLKKFFEIMIKAKINAVYSEDIQTEIWRKYLFILAFSGMTAMKRSTIGGILDNPEAFGTYKQILLEGVKVAEKEGIKLEENFVEKTLDFTKSLNKDAKSSLLVDIEKGNKNEIEALNGRLVSIAKKHSLNVPLNQLIYSSLRGEIGD